MHIWIFNTYFTLKYGKVWQYEIWVKYGAERYLAALPMKSAEICPFQECFRIFLVLKFATEKESAFCHQSNITRKNNEETNLLKTAVGAFVGFVRLSSSCSSVARVSVNPSLII
jgi:hypothetical protein